MIPRIISKETGLFIRDGYTFDDEVEIGLKVEPAEGLYHPKWDFESEKWIEGGTKPEMQPQNPNEKERLDLLEDAILLLMME